MEWYGDELFESLKGKTLKSVTRTRDELHFETTDGERYRQFYDPDCCASCDIEDINGELSDLVGSPILMAEAVSNSDDPPKPSEYGEESYTWTYYKIATIKGSVSIRWYGSSNGYYSERATFERVKE